jgi:ATP-dependent protease Clp ATPase subunit
MKTIGQENLTGDLSRILEIFKNSKAKIRPHFILTGPSGSGKSHTIQSLVNKYNLKLLEINAAQLTKEGTAGNSLSKALSPLVNMGNKLTVCFVDEFDKLFISGNSNSELAHETTNGVQNEFLKVLESNETSVFGEYGKYIQASTKNVLFIFAGAFNGESNISIDRLRELGIKTEFIGRVGLVYNTDKLKLEDMYNILENSELLSNYLKLFKDVDKEKVVLEMKAHIKKNYENNTIGARMITTLINQYFIKGGLDMEDVETITFQNTMSL